VRRSAARTAVSACWSIAISLVWLVPRQARATIGPEISADQHRGLIGSKNRMKPIWLDRPPSDPDAGSNHGEPAPPLLKAPPGQAIIFRLDGAVRFMDVLILICVFNGSGAASGDARNVGPVAMSSLGPI
jgi:hypothetical protein